MLLSNYSLPCDTDALICTSVRTLILSIGHIPLKLIISINRHHAMAFSHCNSYDHLMVIIQCVALILMNDRSTVQLRPSDANMRQYNVPTLVQIMVCRLIGAKPSYEPMLPYCQLDPEEYISVKFYLKFKIFH